MLFEPFWLKIWSLHQHFAPSRIRHLSGCSVLPAQANGNMPAALRLIRNDCRPVPCFLPCCAPDGSPDPENRIPARSTRCRHGLTRSLQLYSCLSLHCLALPCPAGRDQPRLRRRITFHDALARRPLTMPSLSSEAPRLCGATFSLSAVLTALRSSFSSTICSSIA